jgi:TonB family protein
MTKVSMLDFPVWVKAATFDDLAAAYPAKAGGEEGYAVAHCEVRRSGDLRGCVVVKEAPEGHEFGRAALALADKFKVDPKLAETHVSGMMMVDLPVRFPAPAELARRTATAPAWITGFDRAKAPKLFPPEAAAAGLATGRGVARCTVGADGGLTGCAPEAGDPDGQGFSEAAVKLAATMRMNLWGADGAPVEGGVIHVPIRLNLKGTGATGGQ